MMKNVWGFSLLAVTLLFASQALAATWYVDNASTPGGTGMSWASAFQTIQQGIDAAASGDEVWVKKGTYLLSTQILVNEHVSLYAGFSGTETSRSQRNWTQNVTTIDGNNSVRCLYVTTNNAVIDGFTITKGLTTEADRGGGLFNTVSGSSTNTTVANCKFLNNHCPGNSGGGIYDEQGHMTISGCTFQGNTSNNRGGAVYIYYTSASAFGTAAITRCDFIQNTSGSGGALFFKGGTGSGPNSITYCTFRENNAYSTGGSNDGGAIVCDPTTTITGCLFQDNTATRYGTIATFADAGTTITVTSCIFAGNEALYGGGICVNGTSGDLGSLIITNCTFSGNTASGGGGAVYNLKALGPSSQFKVTNCILWNDSTNEIATGGSGGLPAVSYSDIDQNGYAGSNGNVRMDPGFVGGGDYHLAAGSSCIDAGNNSASGLSGQDIDGQPRKLDGDGDGSIVVDMGADEFNTGETSGWGAASTVASGTRSNQGENASRALNSLGMLLLPLGAILLYARWRRRD